MSLKNQRAMLAVVVGWSFCQGPWVKHAFGVLLVLSAMLLPGGVAAAQTVLNFDSSAPMTTAELPNFFDLFGFDAEFGGGDFWQVAGNSVNAANSTNALYTESDGNQLEGWFSRVAILKPDVNDDGQFDFVGENVDLSADITWNDNDNAGLYVRFSGVSDVPLENRYYHVRGTASGDPDGVRLHKVIGGVHTQLFRTTTAPAITELDTANLQVAVETVGNTVEITVSLDGQPLAGMDPFVDDTDPIFGIGRVGVGQETNPTFFDNITINGLDNIRSGDFNSDGVVNSDDFSLLADNFGTGNTFEQGDTNFDLRVDLQDWFDFRELLIAPAGAEGTLAVPEPGSLALICAAGSALLVVRRRNQHLRP